MNSREAEAIAGEILLKTDEMLSRLPREQRERVIGVLDEVHRIRLDAKEGAHAR